MKSMTKEEIITGLKAAVKPEFYRGLSNRCDQPISRTV